MTLIVTVAGGRVFGPFVEGKNKLGWAPDINAMNQALKLGHWNIGGERVWLAPERAFNFSDPRRLLETYRVDPDLDPGLWSCAEAAGEVVLSTAPVLARSDGGPPVGLSLTRRIAPLAAPAGLVVGGLAVAGYRQTLEVIHPPLADGLAVVPWLIRQVALGGAAALSAVDGGRGECVFGFAPPEAVVPRGGAWHVPFGRDGFFKTSYPRHAVGNGGASYTKTDRGQSIAMVYRPVLTEPERYTETLPDEPGGQGQAAALFRDDGRFGSYGEVEFYGHHDGTGRGALAIDCLVLAGAAETVSAALEAYATEISSIPIS
jgi:hypothetical protein